MKTNNQMAAIYTQKYPSLNIFGKIPDRIGAETAQFNRMLKLLNCNSQKIGKWNLILLDVPYKHERGKIIEDDKDWNGQIDIIVLSAHKIIISELKGYYMLNKRLLKLY